MTALPAQYLDETAARTGEHFELTVPPHISYEQLEELLAMRIQTLINEDFSHFIYLLYRTDVAEKKVKQILAAANAAGEDPYRPIARLVIERQLEKIISRATYKQNDLPDDEEKW
ncbi:hypothetical protein [Chitinophaga sp. 212800010-3]|uniref:hypothetical protein n=1 Tax=unclassified Chitinophaga TaxID=2619133 RepID=UPI002DF4A542|nr:Sigma70-r4-2 domain-containing protein [Chitinophaga sp. 212800010-3]